MIQTRGRFFKELEVGDEAVFSRAFTEADVSLAVGLTGDFSPYHIDPEFCAMTRFKKPIVPGLLTASLGAHIGGQWAFLLQELLVNFHGPVYIGDTVTCRMKVTEKNEKNRVRAEFVVTNQNGETVNSGHCLGYPPGRKILDQIARAPGRETA